MDAYYDAYPNLERLGGSSNIIKTALNNLYDSLGMFAWIILLPKIAKILFFLNMMS